MNEEYITEPQKKIPVIGSYDLVVAGGGLTGIMAAITAKRKGLSTIIIENNAFLGGVGTMGLPLQGFYDLDDNLIINGLPVEFLDRLREKKGVTREFIKCEMHNPFAIINPEMVKLVSQEMLLESGVDILLHTMAVEVEKNDLVITGIYIENKSGRQFIKAKIFIDCTGDGDLAFKCGVPFSFGREEDGISQASTLMFRLDNVDIAHLTERVLNDPDEYDLIATLPRLQFEYNKKHILVGLNKLIKKAKSEGLIDLPWDRVCYITCLDDDAVNINMVHVDGKDATNGRELTELEMEGRAQIPVIIKFLTKYVPGFEKPQFTHSASWSGIRETRHIQGESTLNADDINNSHMPEDAVVVGGYPIDIHFSKSDDNGSLHFSKIKPYGIPYGCFLPIGINNLLIAGRSISASHTAMASARVMGTCMGMGQAVGCAAALAVTDNCYPKEVEISNLKEQLLKLGAHL